jgi:hypothetical protein
MKSYSMFVTVVAIAVSGCVPATPIVSDYNGASVKIQTSVLADTSEADAVALAEATRICKTGGKRTAEPASQRPVDEYTIERLYLCL